MELHFGEGIPACPRAGTRAPELATGKLDEMATTAFQSLQGDLQALPQLPKAVPIAAGDWKTLLQD